MRRIILCLVLLTTPACPDPAKDDFSAAHVDLTALPPAWRPVVSIPVQARARWLLNAKKSHRPVRVRPIVVDGVSFPYFVVIEYIIGRVATPHRYETVITKGGEVTARGSIAVAKTLRSAGFPHSPIASAVLLVRLLNYFEIFGERPVWDPFTAGLRQDVVAKFVTPNTLRVDYPQQPAATGGVTAPETHRLVITFDAKSELTMTEAVRPSGGKWGPIRSVLLPRPRHD